MCFVGVGVRLNIARRCRPATSSVAPESHHVQRRAVSSVTRAARSQGVAGEVIARSPAGARRLSTRPGSHSIGTARATAARRPRRPRPAAARTRGTSHDGVAVEAHAVGRTRDRRGSSRPPGSLIEVIVERVLGCRRPRIDAAPSGWVHPKVSVGAANVAPPLRGTCRGRRPPRLALRALAGEAGGETLGGGGAVECDRLGQLAGKRKIGVRENPGSEENRRQFAPHRADRLRRVRRRRRPAGSGSALGARRARDFFVVPRSFLHRSLTGLSASTSNFGIGCPHECAPTVPLLKQKTVDFDGWRVSYSFCSSCIASYARAFLAAVSLLVIFAWQRVQTAIRFASSSRSPPSESPRR